MKVIKKANTEGKYLNWNVVIVAGDSNTENATWKPYGDYSIKKTKKDRYFCLVAVFLYQKLNNVCLILLQINKEI